MSDGEGAGPTGAQAADQEPDVSSSDGRALDPARSQWEREGVMMALYMAVVLLALLVGLGGGDRSRGEEVLLIWGTAVGLFLAHIFAFRMTLALADGWAWDLEHLRTGIAMLVATLSVMLVASLPYALPISKLDASTWASFLLLGVIGVSGYAAARRSGMARPASAGFTVVTVAVAVVVVLIKYNLTH